MIWDAVTFMCGRVITYKVFCILRKSNVQKEFPGLDRGITEGRGGRDWWLQDDRRPIGDTTVTGVEVASSSCREARWIECDIRHFWLYEYVWRWCDEMKYWCDVMWCDMMWHMTWHDMTWCDVMWYDMIWYDMMRCDATWCDVTWRDVRYDVMGYDMVWFAILWYDMMWCDVMWCDVMWRDVTWRDIRWYDMIWYDMIWYDK